jgi:WD40 repeat protein
MKASLCSILVSALVVCISATSPAQQPGKPLPSIDPAKAKLDQTMTGLDGPGFAIVYNAQSGTLLAACERGTIQVWKKDVLLGIRSGSGTSNRLSGHQGPVVALVGQGGRIVASAGADQKIVLWLLPEGISLQQWTSPTVVHALTMSPDGKLLAGGGEDRLVHLWEVPGTKSKANLAEHRDWVCALAFDPVGKHLASSDYQGKVILWDVSVAKKLRDLTPRPMPPPKEGMDPVPAGALAFSPDGKTLAVGSDNGLIQLVNVLDGKLLRPMPGHTSAVTSLRYHPGGNLLASASKDRTIRLWNPANGQLLKTLEGHEAWVQGIVFVSQGMRLASVGADQTVRLWDLAAPK